MKLQLTNSQVTAFATKVGAYTNMPDATTRVLASFAAEGHDPLTRRDLCAVLQALKGGPEDAIYTKEDGVEGWVVINPMLKGSLARAPGRGYYTQGDKVGARTLTEKVVEMAANGGIRIASKAGLSWTPTSVEVDEDLLGYYAEDVGLRRLAANATRCFGSFSARASACRSCPLAPFCATARTAKLGEIAARLDAETEATLKAALEPEVTEAEEVAPTETADEGAPGVMVLPFEGVCSGCQGVMPEGSEGVYVEGAGVHHVACVPKES